MRFLPIPLEDAFVIEPEPAKDERGLFARTFCSHEFQEHGLADSFVQCSVSWNKLKGTLRGLHYQRSPASEVKLIRCTAGSVWDVIVDLRPTSTTYLNHFGVKLSAANRRALYVPKLFAHGFQTLEDATEVFYQMSAVHAPEYAAGVRYDDPKLLIEWPLPVAIMSEKDQLWTPLE
jgi:dTDP-4-dehydrorhamnose 3,5-epimerase